MSRRNRAARLVPVALALAALAGAAEPPRPPFAPKSFAYLLQADALHKDRKVASRFLAGCGRDLVVLDPAYDGSEEGSWTKEEIEAVRAGKEGRKVVAYLSIGEAETYRSYWKKAWDPDKDGKPEKGAPAFLLPVNPDWQGNYKVKYWDPEWQKLILPCVDRIADQGFDGLYLDIVDGFEFFEEDHGKWIDNRPNPETKKTYREDMIAWVSALAGRGREKGGKNFLIIPQNGAQLVEDAKYLELIDGIGIEDLFTDDDEPQAKEYTDSVLAFLKKVQEKKKPVLLIEYGKAAAARKISREGAAKNGLTLLLTDRHLKTLGKTAEEK